MARQALTGRRVAEMVRMGIRATTAGALALSVATFGAAGLAPVEASARALTGTERVALDRRVTAFSTAMRESRSEALVDVVPPRMLAYIADLRHISVDALRRSMLGQMDRIESSGAIASFKIDLADARYESLPDGTPYVLIPTDTVLKAADQKVLKHTNTLAFMDDGTWYLVRINTPALVDRLVAVYPHFAGVDFGGETTTVVP